MENKKNKLIALNNVDYLDKEIILMGGGDYRKNENKKIDNYILNKVGKKANFVFIPFAVKEPEKRLKRIQSIIEVYSGFGIKNFEILDENKMSKKEMQNKIRKAEVLFLTGGDPKLLLKSLQNLNLEKDIINFKRLLIGFSAGGMILSKKCIIPKGIDINYPETIFLDGLGLIDQSFIPHYEKKLDKILKEISKNIDLYAIPEANALYYDLLIKKYNNIGKIYLFSKGKRNLLLF